MDMEYIFEICQELEEQKSRRKKVEVEVEEEMSVGKIIKF